MLVILASHAQYIQHQQLSYFWHDNFFYSNPLSYFKKLSRYFQSFLRLVFPFDGFNMPLILVEIIKYLHFDVYIQQDFPFAFFMFPKVL